MIPHPLGSRSRAEVHAIAIPCAEEIARLACTASNEDAAQRTASNAKLTVPRARRVEAPRGLEAVNAYCQERKWSDGLPLIPPTEERVERMLRNTSRSRDEKIGVIAPSFGVATIERIAINAVLAGCVPDHLPVLIAAVQAVTAPEFNLQSIQTSTHPAAVWMILNGPVAARLGVNATFNCLGQGYSANATLGRALRLIMQNIGGAFPGDMDRSTHGQPGKYSFCCAENEAASPWPPLHVERGFSAEQSTVTVVGAAGTLNLNPHPKDADEMVRAIGSSMAYGTSNDYRLVGAPWIILGPESADFFREDKWTKEKLKRGLWEASKMQGREMTLMDLERTRQGRASELGEIDADTWLPVSARPEEIGILVAGGPGSHHCVYVPSFGDTRAVTREIL